MATTYNVDYSGSTPYIEWGTGSTPYVDYQQWYTASKDLYQIPGSYFTTNYQFDKVKEAPNMTDLAMLAEGLTKAVKAGFISKKEARREFRNNVPSIIIARADRLKAKELRKKAKALIKEANAL
jgi:hypothetical protein